MCLSRTISSSVYMYVLACVRLRQQGVNLREENDALHEDLSLTAANQTTSASKWQFGDDSETHLSQWIQKNCQYNAAEYDNSDDAAPDEIRLIVKHTPPLNITHNREKTTKLSKARKNARRALGK